MATTMFAGCGSSSEENTTADNNQTAAPAATEAAAEESTEAAAPAVSADGKIAMITDSGDITDESFNQITWETCVAYGDKNGIEYQYYKPAEDTDEGENQRNRPCSCRRCNRNRYAGLSVRTGNR